MEIYIDYLATKRDTLHKQLKLAQKQSREAIEKCAIHMHVGSRDNNDVDVVKNKSSKPCDHSSAREVRDDEQSLLPFRYASDGVNEKGNKFASDW